MIVNLDYNARVNPDYIAQRIIGSNQICYLPIPKNASMWADDVFTSLNFKKHKFDHTLDSYKFLLNKKCMIFLRNPIERWYSGVAQFFSQQVEDPNVEYILDNKTLHLIFSAVRMDVHTDLQINFILGIDYNDCLFFDIGDKNFPHQVYHYLIMKQIAFDRHLLNRPPPKNTSESFVVKQSIVNQLKHHAKKNPHDLLKVHSYYNADIRLYNWLSKGRFYNPEMAQEKQLVIEPIIVKSKHEPN